MNNSSVTERLWTKDFIVLSLSSALVFSGFHILIPVLPLFIANHGGTDSEIGLIMGSFTFSAVLIRLFTENGIRRLGKEHFLISGIFICMAATAAYYWAESVGVVLSVRILHGFGFGIATTMYATLVVDIIPVARRGEGMGYFGLGATIMMAVAPALGVWLVDGYGFASLFTVATAGQLAAFLGLRAFYRTPGASGHEPGLASRFSLLERVMERRVAFPAFLSLLTGICVGGVLSFVTLMAKAVQLSTVGYFFLVATACVFLSRLVVGRIFDRKGPAWVILPGAVSLCIGQVILSQVATTQELLTAAVFHGLGTGALFPSLQAWMVNLVEPAKRGTVNATFYNFIDAGVGGGAIMLGIVAEKFGYTVLYLASACCVAVFVVIYAVYIVRYPATPWARDHTATRRG